MEVKMPPCLRSEMLNGSIEHGCRCHCQRQQGRIERRNIVEMHDIGMMAHQGAEQIGDTYEQYHDEKYHQMDVRESRDKLRNGVIRIDMGQQVALVCPTDIVLIQRHLHPDGVDCVCRQDANVCHHHMCVAGNGKRIGRQVVDLLLRQLPNQLQGVGAHDEIEVASIVMCPQKRD